METCSFMWMCFGKVNIRKACVSLSASQPLEIPLLRTLCFPLYPTFKLACLFFGVQHFNSLYTLNTSPQLVTEEAISYFLLHQIQCIWFMLRSLIHLDQSFVQGNKYGSNCILLHADCQLDQRHLLKMLSFFHCLVLATLSKIKCAQMFGFISGNLILFY